ncbi:MAG: hypothetical protein ACLPHP_17000 [Candidatus Sulfotelmatobacter sp.]
MEHLEESVVEAPIQPEVGAAITVSPRKIAANRQNARKSTGPKTPRSKAYSRRNALKHGFFARDTVDFLAHGEDRRAYAKLLKGLRDGYQPVGMAEELEVELISVCWWKLKRARRCADKSNRAARYDFGSATRERRRRRLESDLPMGKVIRQLQNAEEEIKGRGEVQRELKRAIFETMPTLELEWPGFETSAQRVIDDPMWQKEFPVGSPKELASQLAWCTASLAVKTLSRRMSKLTDELLTELETAEYLIPLPDSLDRVQRYESAAERSLNRAIERLDHLQRCRKEEPVPPSVNVRPTQ